MTSPGVPSFLKVACFAVVVFSGISSCRREREEVNPWSLVNQAMRSEDWDLAERLIREISPDEMRGNTRFNLPELLNLLFRPNLPDPVRLLLGGRIIANSVLDETDTILHRLLSLFPEDRRVFVAEAIYRGISLADVADPATFPWVRSFHLAILRKEEAAVRDIILQVPTNFLEHGISIFLRGLERNQLVSELIVLALIEKLPPRTMNSHMVFILKYIEQDRKWHVLKTFFRKLPVADLERAGIFFPLLRRVQTGQATQAEITQFIESKTSAQWTALNLNDSIMGCSPLGLTICLCSHVKEYEKVLLQLLPRLPSATFTSPCGPFLSIPIFHIVAVGAFQSQSLSIAVEKMDDPSRSLQELLFLVNLISTGLWDETPSLNLHRRLPLKVLQEQALAFIAKIPPEKFTDEIRYHKKAILKKLIGENAASFVEARRLGSRPKRS